MGSCRWRVGSVEGEEKKTTPSIVAAPLPMPACVNHYPKQLHSQTKNGHIKKERMRKMYESFFLSPHFPRSFFFPLSANTLRGIFGNNVSLRVHWGFVELWITLLPWVCENCGDVHHQCQTQLWEKNVNQWYNFVTQRQVQCGCGRQEFICVLSGSRTVEHLLKIRLDLTDLLIWCSS